MYRLLEYNENYLKHQKFFWQYYKDELNDNLGNSESFEFKANNNTKYS